MKKMLLLVGVVIALFAGSAYASITDVLTPGHIPEDALSYSQETNCPKSGLFGLYTSKRDIERFRSHTDAYHLREVLRLQHLADKDNLNFKIAVDQTATAYRNATEIQNTLVDPLFDIGMKALFGLTGLGAGALFIKRPKDITLKTYESDIDTALKKDPPPIE